MTANINDKLNDLISAIKAEMPNTTTSVKIFINCEGFTFDTTCRDAEGLKRDSYTMRNLKGDWIK